jgi:hypothetical protein
MRFHALAHRIVSITLNACASNCPHGLADGAQGDPLPSRMHGQSEAGDLP